MRVALFLLSFAATTFSPCSAVQWLTRVPLEHGRGMSAMPAAGRLYFLEFGGHSFTPDTVDDRSVDRAGLDERLKSSIPIALFQQLRATTLLAPVGSAGTSIQLTKNQRRDAFWDQIILVQPQAAWRTATI